MSNSKGKVLIAAPVHDILIQGLRDAGYNCDFQLSIKQADAAGLLADCTGIITSTRLNIDKQLLDTAPQLKWIGRMGSGMEIVDVPYALSKGIACYSSPEGNCNAVGEHALGMLLNLTRRISVSNAEMKQGVWLRDENRGIELEGKTIGIIGYGHTGRAFAKKLSGFDMRILAYDKYATPATDSLVIGVESLERIYEEADIISFHVPLQADTRHYFNTDFLQAMRKPFILMNTSRGPVVSLSSVYEGVQQAKIIGVCLDVFEQEPLTRFTVEEQQKMNHLITLPQVITTPHIAGYTFEALFKMSKTLLTKII